MNALLAPIIICFAFYDHAYLVAATCEEWITPYGTQYFISDIKHMRGVRDAYIDADYEDGEELVIVELEEPWP